MPAHAAVAVKILMKSDKDTPSIAKGMDIHFVDTTLRDGQLSLWASNMTTGMMLPIVENIDRAGFEGIFTGFDAEPNLWPCVKREQLNLQCRGLPVRDL